MNDGQYQITISINIERSAGDPAGKTATVELSTSRPEGLYLVGKLYPREMDFVSVVRDELKGRMDKLPGREGDEL